MTLDKYKARASCFGGALFVCILAVRRSEGRAGGACVRRAHCPSLETGTPPYGGDRLRLRLTPHKAVERRQ